MKYFLMSKAGTCLGITSDYKDTEINEYEDAEWVSRWNWDTAAEAQKVADAAEARSGHVFLVSDRGGWVSPRFDVVEAPRIGDKVSKSFNGDSYPDGEIVKIAKNYRYVQTSTGRKYWKKGKTASFVLTGGTFYMISGHVEERNPHF